MSTLSKNSNINSVDIVTEMPPPQPIWSQFNAHLGVSPLVMWDQDGDIPEIICENGIQWKVCFRYPNGNVIITDGTYKRYVIKKT